MATTKKKTKTAKPKKASVPRVRIQQPEEIDYTAVASNIFATIRNLGENCPISAYEDAYQIAFNCMETDRQRAHEITMYLRALVTKALKAQYGDPEQFYEIYRKCLLMDAHDYLDEFLLYNEIDRPLEERFYQTRRKVLKPVVDAIQDLADDRLDELFIAMPPRTGKSSLLAFTISWLMGRKPDVPNLYSSYTGNIVGKFYDAVLEIMSDKHTYRWGDVFPQKEKIKTDALEHTVNLGRPKHYPTLTCRSIDGTLNGACDVDGGFSIGDDFVSGIEEALSKDRMLKLWSKVSNDYMSRGKPATTKYVWMGTRWSQIDPEGMRLDLLENGAETSKRRFRVINLPALNENDESNFDYPYKKGFSTEAYRMLRENFERNNDMASWLAQYQGTPIEREGTLFSSGDFSYYNGVLPDEAPDRVFMAVDPAYGGGDFVAAPICFQYGDICYVEDVVYNDGDKRITQPDIANKAKRYNVSVIQIEVNKSTEGYKDGLQSALTRIGHRATIRTKNSSSQTAKWQRIFDKAPDIRETFVFRDTGHRSREYTKFMENVFSYKFNLSERGLKKQHDDAPDSLAQAIDMIMKKTQQFQIISRPF